ncbi:MAG: hypothetical protein Q9227_008557 [Pyrenula ochraceoflavens]
MHAYLLLCLALSSLTFAEDQKPLKEKAQGWFDKAKSYIPTAAATAPIDAGASKVAEKAVATFTPENWQTLLKPKSSEPSRGPEEWMILVSGGNKSCFGECGMVEKAWKQSISLLSADPTSPFLGYLNCDKSPLLCSIWATGVPSVWHYSIPIASVSQSQAPTTLHIVPLKTNDTSTQDIVKIHSEKTYTKVPAYEGMFHPIDGALAKTGLLVPLGYVFYGFSAVPSWMFMIGISFLSRTIM